MILPLLIAGASAYATAKVGQDAQERAKERKAADQARIKNEDEIRKYLIGAAEKGNYQAFHDPEIGQAGGFDSETFNALHRNAVLTGLSKAQIMSSLMGGDASSVGIEPPPGAAFQRAALPNPQQQPLPTAGPTGQPVQGPQPAMPMAGSATTGMGGPRAPVGGGSVQPDIAREADDQNQALAGRTPAITIPRPRAGRSVTTQPMEGVSVTTHVPGVSDEQAVEGVLAQARQHRWVDPRNGSEHQGMFPQMVETLFDQANVERVKAGQAPIKVDPQQIRGYKNDYWSKEYAAKVAAKVAGGTDPATAQQAAAKDTFTELGYVPDGMMDLVKPSPTELRAAVETQVLHRLDSKFKAGLGTLISPTAAKALPGEEAATHAEFRPDWLGHEVDNEPGLTLEQRDQFKKLLAGKLAFSLAQKWQAQPGMENAPPEMLLYRAIHEAALSTGGVVPDTFKAYVASNPQAFGMPNDDITKSVYMSGKFNIWEPGGMQKLQDATSQMALQAELMKRGTQLLNQPDVVASMMAATQADKGEGGVTPEAALSKAGKQQRAIEVEQRGAITKEERTQAQSVAIAPTAEVEKVKPLDDLYTTGVRLQQIASVKDAQGQTFLDKYGDEPAMYFSTKTAFQRQFGKVPDEVAKYISLLGKIFNVEKKTFAGTATSLNERSDLLSFMPDPKDNLRTAIQKINTLVGSVGGELQRDLGYIEQNYPGTKLEMFNYKRIQGERQKQREKTPQETPAAKPAPQPKEYPKSKEGPQMPAKGEGMGWEDAVVARARQAGGTLDLRPLRQEFERKFDELNNAHKEKAAAGTKEGWVDSYLRRIKKALEARGLKWTGE